MRFIFRGAWFVLTLVGVSADTVLGLPQQPIQISSDEDVIFDPAFDAFVENLLQELHVPGLSIAVVDNGKIASKGYGFAHLPDHKATADTQYFTGSTTKAFTAAALALLVHDDKYPEVKWTSPINKFIREDFVLEDAYATSHTTIEDALSHRSGMPRHDLIYRQPNDTPSSVVRRMRYLPMTAEPRTKWQYCNIMYGVITDLIETITGQKLETILRDNFWRPLGMSSTTFTIPSAIGQDSRLARGYYWNSSITEDFISLDRGNYVPDPYEDISPISGAGATISTVNDYALWIRALLDAANLDHSQNTTSPIAHRIFRDVMTPRAIVSDVLELEGSELVMPPLYALGWIMLEVLSEKLVAHDGAVTGFGTLVYMLPGMNYGIVTMGNTEGTSNDAGAIIASRLLRKVFNVSETQTGTFSGIESNLLKIRKASLRPKRAMHRRNTFSKGHKPTPRPKPLPLPLSIDDFAGLYSHPAYGTINLTVAASQPTSSPPENILEGLLNPRTWPQKVQLSHITGTLFSVKNFEPHGLGDIISGKGIVWEDVGDCQAVFEFGLDGEEVETMGIELEESMVEMAMEMGEKHWRDGMIWFEKV